MQDEKFNSTNIRIIFILLFVVLSGTLFVVLNHKKTSNEEKHLALITERYQLAFNTIFNQHEQLALNLQSGLVARFGIQNLYQKLLTADQQEKNKLRQDLLDQMKSRFEELQQEGQVQYLHFHLRDNESFLRLHGPEKFGDNLTEIRPTVAFVNSEHKAISGFENGRMHGGFRFVFPITGADQTHLGSMEVSFGPEAITSAIMKQHYVLSNVFIQKKNASEKLFMAEGQTKYANSHHEGFYYDTKVLAALKDVARKDIKELRPQKAITDAIRLNALSGQTTSLYDPDTDLVFTTIPILNPVTHELIAFCTIRSQTDIFAQEIQHFRMGFIIISFLLAITFLVFYFQFTQRKILEIHSGNLEIQKRQLLTTQKTLQLERDMFIQGPVMTFTWQNSENWPVTQVSENVLGILGYSAEEFLDGSVQYVSLIHPDDYQPCMDEVKQNSGPGKNSFIHAPYRLRSRSEKDVWVYDSTTLVRDAQDKIIQYKGYLVDITEMVMMEKEFAETKDRLETSQRDEQLKRFESLKTMAGAIAHRFNNSMTIVSGNIELLKKTLPDGSDSSHLASQAALSAQGASRIGSILLSYVGQKPLNLKDLSLSDITAESIKAIEDQLPSSISLQFIPPEHPTFCSVDQNQIMEVVGSILTNAIESLDDHAGTIEVSMGKARFETKTFPIPFQDQNLKDGEYVFCQIKDSGRGISPKNLALVFEPFFTTRFVGRGLGLALTAGVMRSHHGAVIIESIQDVGTTVSLLFPPVSPDSLKITPTVEAEAEDTKLFSGNILFVDDEELILELGKRMLLLLGFDVQTASSGQEAVALVQSQKEQFRAVVMDISMPLMDGFEAMKEIKKSDPSLPVLLSSGYSEEEFKGTHEEMPDGFLTKPFLLKDLRNCLEDLL